MHTSRVPVYRGRYNVQGSREREKIETIQVVAPFGNEKEKSRVSGFSLDVCKVSHKTLVKSGRIIKASKKNENYTRMRGGEEGGEEKSSTFSQP